MYLPSYFSSHSCRVFLLILRLSIFRFRTLRFSPEPRAPVSIKIRSRISLLLVFQSSTYLSLSFFNCFCALIRAGSWIFRAISFVCSKSSSVALIFLISEATSGSFLNSTSIRFCSSSLF